MTLRLQGTTGFTEVKAPAAAGNNTLTLQTSNGSANQVLKNGSTAGALEFGTLPTSGYTAYGSTATTTGNTHTVTGLDTSHTHFIITFHGVSVSTTTTPSLVAQIGNGSLSNSGYTGSVGYRSGSQQFGAATDIDLTHTDFSNVGNEFSGALQIFCNANDSVVGTWMLFSSIANEPLYGAFRWTTGTTIDRFSLQTAATAFDSGRFDIFSR